MRSGVLYAFAASVLFGVSGVVAVAAFTAVTPFQMTQFRSVVTALILGGFAYRRRQTMTGGNLPMLGVLGVLLSAVTITFYIAIDRLGVGPGVTLQFLGPALVLVWMKVVQRKAVPGAAWVAAMVAVTGTSLMNRAWEIDSADPLGVAAGLAAAVTFAAYLVVGEHLGKRLPSLTVMAYGFAVAALIWVVVLPPRIPAVDGVVWGQLVWVAVAGTAAPFLLEMVALRRADPGTVGVVATAEPVIAGGVAWAYLGEALTPIQVTGGLLVVVGIGIIQFVTNSVAPDIPDLAV